MKGRGHRRREGAHRPLPFSLSPHGHLRAETLMDRVVLPELVPASVSRVVDQDEEGVCFACAPARALAYACAMMGITLPFDPSILDLATLVHALERAAGTGSPKLWDWGGDPADVATVVSQWGIRPARYRDGTTEAARFCDVSRDTIGPDHEPVGAEAGGIEPTLADLEVDAVTLFPGVHELDPADPILAARQSLANGAPITIAWLPLDADENPTADAVLDVRDGEPDHDSLIVGYEKQPDGTFHFLLQNSWSDAWGSGGRLWTTEAFMRSSAFDRYSFSVRRAS